MFGMAVGRCGLLGHAGTKKVVHCWHGHEWYMAMNIAHMYFLGTAEVKVPQEKHGHVCLRPELRCVIGGKLCRLCQNTMCCGTTVNESAATSSVFVSVSGMTDNTHGRAWL